MTQRGRKATIEAGICPECKQRVKFIVSIRGSRMAVNWKPLAIWIYDDASGLHEIHTGWRTHNYNCTARDKHRRCELEGAKK